MGPSGGLVEQEAVRCLQVIRKGPTTCKAELDSFKDELERRDHPAATVYGLILEQLRASKKRQKPSLRWRVRSPYF